VGFFFIFLAENYDKQANRGDAGGSRGNQEKGMNPEISHQPPHQVLFKFFAWGALCFSLGGGTKRA